MFRESIIRLSIALVILVVVLSALVVSDYLTRPKAVTLKDLGLDEKAIEKTGYISIKRGDGKEIIIEKKKSEWIVNGYQADRDKISEFLSSLSNMAVDADLGSVKGKEREYSLDRLSRIELILKTNGRKSVLYFGKPGPYLHSRYMTIEGRENIYLVSGLFADSLGYELNDWREKRLFNSDEIIEISVETTQQAWIGKIGKDSLEVTVDGKSKKIEKEEFEKFKIDLDSFRAEDFVDKPGRDDLKYFEREVVLIQLKQKDGRIIRLQGAKKDEDYYIFRKDNSETLYLVPVYRLEFVLENPIESYSGSKN